MSVGEAVLNVISEENRDIHNLVSRNNRAAHLFSTTPNGLRPNELRRSSSVGSHLT
jgi:hypothetical protein